MERRLFLCWSVLGLLLLLSADYSESFFSSLPLTRDALMEFARGSQRTVDINLGPKNVTKMVNKTYFVIGASGGCGRKRCMASFPRIVEARRSDKKNSGNRKTGPYFTISSNKVKSLFEVLSLTKALPNQLLTTKQVNEKGELIPMIIIPYNETVITSQTKREVYEPRTSPSNKFMKVVNDLGREEANAKALGLKYRNSTLTKLKGLAEKAIQSKSYIYARQVR